MPIDPITLEVLRNRFDTIAEEMEVTLLRSSYSIIVKEGSDASSALFDAEGQTIAQATSIPGHLGMLIPSVNRILRSFPTATMREGDAYILNDPYDGGTHLPDVTMVVPVLHGGRVVALGCTMTHHQDMGGKSPGSIPTDSTEIFQEGLILPPVKFYDAGRPVEAIHEIIRRNVRIPDIVMGDFQAQLAAGCVAQVRFNELVARSGLETVLAAKTALFDRAEAMTRAAVAAIPDGAYRFVDVLDNDGVDLDRRVEIAATVTIRGSDFLVDFTGTSPQCRGPMNSVPSSTTASVYYVLRAIADPHIPNNAGCYRPVRVTLPPGTLVNPVPPAPVCARTATVKRICDVLFGALVQAMPDRIPAAPGGELVVMGVGGIDPRTGKAYVTSELATCGYGARSAKDGIDLIETDATNAMNIPAEAIEAAAPIRIGRFGIRSDSGGGGRFRGGCGMDKVWEVVRGEASFSYRGERHFESPWGLFGGLPGQRAEARIVRADGRVEPIPSKATFILRAGERLEFLSAGGAGHGDPLERPPQSVLEDLHDRKVSAATAEAVYGVVLDPAGQRVDVERTKARRETMRATRGPITWTFDHGDGRRV